MHLESESHRGRRVAALVRRGWTPPEHLSGPVRDDEGRAVDLVLRWRLDLPLAFVRLGARRDPRELIEAARRSGVPFAYALGRRRVRELALPQLGVAGPARERELACVPTPKELWRRYRRSLGLTREGARLLEASLARGADPRRAPLAEGACAAAERRTLEAAALGRRRALCILPGAADRAAVAARVARRLGAALASRDAGEGLPRTLVLAPDRGRLDELAAAFAACADEALVLATPRDVELRTRPPVARLARGAFDLVVVDGLFSGTARDELEAVLAHDERALQLAFSPACGAETRARAESRFGPALVDATPAAERLLDDLERAAREVARVHDVEPASEDASELARDREKDRTQDMERVRAAVTRDELLERWPSPRTRERLLAGLAEAGIDLAALAARADAPAAPAADGLDLLLHVGWDAPLVARRERADRLRRRAPRVWAAASDEERAVLGLVLERYVAHGLAEPWLPGRLDARALRALGGARVLDAFGEPRRLRKALRRLARELVAERGAGRPKRSGAR